MPTVSASKKEKDNFKVNDELPLVFADVMRVSRRNDGMILVQFAAAILGEFREQTRVIFPGKAAHGLIDLLCEMSGHYPSKPESVSPSAPAKKLGK